MYIFYEIKMIFANNAEFKFMKKDSEKKKLIF